MAATLAIKICLLDWNRGEYTDGIIQLNLWESPVVFFPPGYSGLVWLMNLLTDDLLIAGRLVSILASTAALGVFYTFAFAVLQSRKAALLATLFLACSPIFNRWSIRVMTDALFCLLFIQCCRVYWNALTHTTASLAPLFFWAGVASLIRYQGFFFVALGVYLLWIKRREIQITVYGLAGCLAASLPWLALAGWIVWRGFGHHQQFIERGSSGLGLTTLLYYNMFETYLIYWPWAITYLLFALGVIGWAAMASAKNNGRRFALFSLIAAAVFLIAQSAFLSFQYRYLLPLLPLWCIAAAHGWMRFSEWIRLPIYRSASLGLVLANLILMSAAVIVLQRGGAFGDLADSARYFKNVWPNARILSDEVYREGVYNPKVEFWSGRKVELYWPERSDIRTGDIILLHNAYSDFEQVYDHLSERFELHVLGRWQAHSTPLLPDIMVYPSQVPLTSNPPAMGFRFMRQNYLTVAIRLERER